MPSYVIVGASRGLGYEWLRQLSSDQSNTVIGIVRSVSSVKARIASDRIENIEIIEGDMVNHVSLTAAAAQVSKLTNDSLDVLIVNGAYNNAETFKIKPSAFAGQEDLLRRDLIASIDVNVLGVVHSINAFLPLIRKGIFKKIIVISTGLADVDVTINSENPMSVVYSTSKAALNMIVAKYAAELKSEGVILLALSPGVVNTKETIPSAQEIAEYAAMVESFQKFAPHWKGAITPAESVELQKKVIDNVTIAESGAFLSHWGNKIWL